MDILFQGKHNSEEAAESLLSILRLFKERYQISQFDEMKLSLTLINQIGEEVELVDSESSQVYRRFEVYRGSKDLQAKNEHPSGPHLVIDNTRK